MGKEQSVTKGTLKTILALMGAAVLTAAVVTTAEPPAAGTAEPTTKPARATRRHGKVPAPWSDITTLTPQQQEQILKIHGDALDQEAKIREKEKDDITALLTPAQQTELTDAQSKIKEEKKAMTATLKHRATTAPAN
jgi:Spy/CpxP family protein refolding chaperone